MTPLFLIPFFTGVFHSISIQQKKPKQWGITLSLIGTSSIYFTLPKIQEQYFIKAEHLKQIPSKLSVPGFLASSFFFSSLHCGAFFCMGHLLTKKAYPVFMDE